MAVCVPNKKSEQLPVEFSKTPVTLSMSGSRV